MERISHMNRLATILVAMARGDVKVEGRPGAFGELMGMLVGG
jgi:hypothetical protein